MNSALFSSGRLASAPGDLVGLVPDQQVVGILAVTSANVDPRELSRLLAAMDAALEWPELTAC